MLKLVPADQLSASFFRGFLWLSVALALAGVVWSETAWLAWWCVAVNLACGAAYRSPALHRLPGALILAMLTMVYFQFPLWYLTLRGSRFDYGNAFDVPGTNAEYFSALVPAVLFFFVCLAASVWGVKAGTTYRTDPVARVPPLSRIGLAVLVAVGVYVTWVQIGDIRGIFTARAEESAKAESFVALLFNDKAYQLVFPVLFYLFPVDFRTRTVRSVFLLVLGLFLALNVYSTSKGAILTIATSFFLYPAAMFSQRRTPVYWPTRTVVAVVMVAIVPLYFVAMVSRQFQASGEPLTVGATITALNTVLANVSSDGENALDPIALRLSSNLTNVVTIYREFVQLPDTSHRPEFRAYVTDSFLNLVLPGTPYPDAYVPSSQLLPEVLMRAKLESNLDRVTFLAAANTQPYTLPGFGLVAFGATATVVLMWLSGWTYAAVYRRATGLMTRLVVMFTFMTMLVCYGFETGVQYAIMTAVTSGFLVVLVVGAGWRRRASRLVEGHGQPEFEPR